MSTPSITQEEFIAAYCGQGNETWEELQKTHFVARCDCAYEGCKGWIMEPIQRCTNEEIDIARRRGYRVPEANALRFLQTVQQQHYVIERSEYEPISDTMFALNSARVPLIQRMGETLSSSAIQELRTSTRRKIVFIMGSGFHVCVRPSEPIFASADVARIGDKYVYNFYGTLAIVDNTQDPDHGFLALTDLAPTQTQQEKS